MGEGVTALALLVITATVPLTDDARDVSELLRQAAVKAGCQEPRVSMRWQGFRNQLEIEVRCADGGNR